MASIVSIRKQLIADMELRSGLQFFFISFIPPFFCNFLSLYAAIIFLVLITPLSYLYGKKNNFKYQCTTQAALLGSVCGFALSYSVMYSSEKSSLLSRYFVALSIFHFSEYIFTAISNRRSLQPSSFLLDHSYGYWAAAVLSWIEFIAELHLFPNMKVSAISYIGLIGCLSGEILRKLAMLHAGIGFTHRLALSKRLDHKLVTGGIYSIMRHPGYCGWFLWAVSTQIVLCNPVCAIIYAYVTWSFFSQRIYDEEVDLIKFFGSDYTEYKEKVVSGVPFVSGFPL